MDIIKITLICISCSLIPVIIFGIMITLAPNGREDKDGFHREDKS